MTFDTAAARQAVKAVLENPQIFDGGHVLTATSLSAACDEIERLRLLAIRLEEAFQEENQSDI